MPSKRSVTATPFCKICHKKIEQNSFFSLIFTPKNICLRCFLALKPTYFRWKEKGVRFLAIYPYNEAYQSLIYQFKGCGDIELAPCFLERLNLALKIRFRGYRIVYAPSHPSKIQERGFDHVPLMFEGLGLPILHAFSKIFDVKQSSQSKGERKKVGKYISLSDSHGIKGQKILVVDDVFTTGSTIRACLRLVLKCRPKRVAVLVLAKVPKPSEKGHVPTRNANMRA